MPIYEYRCQTCDEVLEIIVRGGKQPKICGKHCVNIDAQGQGNGQGKLKKLLSLPSAHHTPKTDSDIAAAGLTKLKKTSDGDYRRVAGPKIDGFD